MILSVSRYVIQKEEQRKQEEELINKEKLQAAAQALMTHAQELVNSDSTEENDETYEREEMKDFNNKSVSY